MDAAREGQAPGASIYVGVLLVSVAALALEVIFTRTFSFTIWYHFTYLTINAALLGFCSSGAVLAIWPKLLRRFGPRLMCGCALLAAVFAVLLLFLSADNPLEPQQLFEQPWTFSLRLLAYYCGIALPFFFVGATIVAAFSWAPAHIARLYFADLAGAGIGAVVALILILWLQPPAAIFACALLLIGAAACFARPLGLRLQYGLLAAAVVLLPAMFWVKDNLNLKPAASTYVGQFQSDTRKFARVHSEWNPISRIDVYQSLDPKSDWSYPQWTYDGNSTQSSSRDHKPPPFYFLIYDAHNRSDIYQLGKNPTNLQFLDRHLLKTPYVLKKNPRVLVMGSGGGIDVLNARRNGAQSIVAVELQPSVVALLKGRLSAWVGDIFTQDPHIKLVAQEARNYLRQDRAQYDLIQFTATDTWAAQNTGTYVLTESYLYTEEAISEYLDHLVEDGILCLIVWDAIKEQTREFLQPINSRLMLQYLNVLEARGVDSPSRHIAILGKREWYGNMFTVPLLKKSPFTAQELEQLRQFAGANGFEVLYDPYRPGMPNALSRLITAPPVLREELLSNAFFNIKPTTDDSPFFFNCFRWKNLAGIDATTWSQPASGQLVLLAMLGQSILLAVPCPRAPCSGPCP